MIPSRYNLVTKMDDQNFALFNPLSGAFDIVDEKFADSILKGTLPSESDRTVLLERGYFFQSKSAEEAYIQERYQDFLNESSLNKTQFLLVPSYSCNFHCPYCYQKGVPSQSETMSNEMVYSFVDFIKKYKMLNRKEIMVTLFGGEPLLPGSARKETVRLLIELLNQNDVGLSVVTNGYYFEEYLEILKAAKIEEIHFTLDGDAEIHNRRRFEKEGENSFERIIRAMGKAVEVGFPVNLRLITDRLTLETFPALAVKLEQAGFPDLPKDKFKTSLGRNYELYNDYIKPEDLFTLDQMVSAYVNKMMAYPILKKLHRPSFFGMTQLVENREMFLPSFDTCPGAKSEYVFDASGKIFSWYRFMRQGWLCHRDFLSGIKV